MTGQAVFEQLVNFVSQDTQNSAVISEADYAQWKRDYIWLALHGQRYGQSFCNRFGIQDNHLYYAAGNVVWCDRYIRENYVA